MWSFFQEIYKEKKRECNASHMECDNVYFLCQLNVANNNIKDKVEKCVKQLKTDKM